MGNEGGDEKSQFARVVSRKNSAMQRCHQAWALSAKAAPRVLKVKATLTIGTEGAVTDVQVAGAPPELAACMVEKLKAIRGMPALLVPTVYAHSYEFQSQ